GACSGQEDFVHRSHRSHRRANHLWLSRPTSHRASLPRDERSLLHSLLPALPLDRPHAPRPCLFLCSGPHAGLPAAPPREPSGSHHYTVPSDGATQRDQGNHELLSRAKRRKASSGRPAPLRAHPHAPGSSTRTDFSHCSVGSFSGRLVYTPFLSDRNLKNPLQLGLFASSAGENQAISRKVRLGLAELVRPLRFSAKLTD